jgi:hypothetical protein
VRLDHLLYRESSSGKACMMLTLIGFLNLSATRMGL